MEKQKATWMGASRNYYEFEVYEIDMNFKSFLDGNFIFAKNVNNIWKAVYIGEGNLQEEIFNTQYRSDAIKNGATHIHVHENNSEYVRKMEEEDLLGYHTEAYIPNGCNINIK